MTSRLFYTPDPGLEARWSSARGVMAPRHVWVSNRFIAVPIFVVGLVWAAFELIGDAIFGRFE